MSASDDLEILPPQSNKSTDASVTDNRGVCVGGSSLRMAIKQSLSVDRVDPQSPPPQSPRSPAPKKSSHNKSTNHSDKEKMIKYNANPTIVNMWAGQSSLHSSMDDGIKPTKPMYCTRNMLGQMPIEMLSTIIPSYLNVLDLSAFRGTCRVAWSCVSTHAFDRNVIALCQGQYTALCESVAMLTERQYELCGLTRPKWTHAHNIACQVRCCILDYILYGGGGGKGGEGAGGE